LGGRSGRPLRKDLATEEKKNKGGGKKKEGQASFGGGKAFLHTNGKEPAPTSEKDPIDLGGGVKGKGMNRQSR